MKKDKKIKMIAGSYDFIHSTNLDDKFMFLYNSFKDSEFVETKSLTFFKKIKFNWKHFILFSLIFSFYWVFTPLFYLNNLKELKIIWIILSSVISFLYSVFLILSISKQVFYLRAKRIIKLKVNLVALNHFLSLIEDKNINIKRFNIVSKTEIIKKYFDNDQLKSNFYLEIKTTNDQSIFWNCYDKNNSTLMFYFENNKMIGHHLKEKVDIFNYRIITHYFIGSIVWYLMVKEFIEKLKILTKEIN
ncbi:hypothetical protein [Mesomycoplasma lagogenitalium]|uniref:DUF3137 domain-containing protein n=1 Tax=Mesomycoplasma lagogenitalium TaxID=171286 RepID=A0ABY8LVQ1_9BACT|nr:hypothetical protein [Mesomycoplasma lagogenitalium]WGI36613.1 hypothetical protein QEG99_04075 [Mesomycoplasma lagogenitalium]